MLLLTVMMLMGRPLLLLLPLVKGRRVHRVVMVNVAETVAARGGRMVLMRLLPSSTPIISTGCIRVPALVGLRIWSIARIVAVLLLRTRRHVVLRLSAVLLLHHLHPELRIRSHHRDLLVTVFLPLFVALLAFLAAVVLLLFELFDFSPVRKERMVSPRLLY